MLTYREPFQRYTETNIEVDRPRYESQIDINEHQYRQQTTPILVDEYDRRYPESVDTRYKVETTVDGARPHHHHHDMGYYDEDGHYHSFRHGINKAADRVLHPLHGHHGHHHHRDHAEVDIDIETSRGPRLERTEHVSSYANRRPGPPNTITIPCHHIRIGDLLILQGRPCQVIRITTSPHTGQHRYLGVDLFTKQLHEESSFVSNPSPSVIVQNMLGPVFKQYRVLDIRDDGYVVAMTETGDVKQGLPLIDQGGLFNRLSDSFANGRGSVRVLVINDGGRELAVDYKVVHGSRL
ncbi:MAG: woronin body major protein [Vezdaea aestivalis]|nr:MAG: woronin body major protein [Vezdaea aestivalis]